MTSIATITMLKDNISPNIWGRFKVSTRAKVALLFRSCWKTGDSTGESQFSQTSKRRISSNCPAAGSTSVQQVFPQQNLDQIELAGNFCCCISACWNVLANAAGVGQGRIRSYLGRVHQSSHSFKSGKINQEKQIWSPTMVNWVGW